MCHFAAPLASASACPAGSQTRVLPAACLPCTWHLADVIRTLLSRNAIAVASVCQLAVIQQPRTVRRVLLCSTSLHKRSRNGWVVESSASSAWVPSRHSRLHRKTAMAARMPLSVASHRMRHDTSIGWCEQPQPPARPAPLWYVLICNWRRISKAP